MDEQAIKILARFTEIGELWPMGAWIWNNGEPNAQKSWYRCKCNSWVRYKTELSEIEANQKGIFKENGPIIQIAEEA